MELVIVFVLAAGILAGAFALRHSGYRFSWFSFYLKGKESGFQFREINLLHKAAVAGGLPSPTAIFWSEKALDRCIRHIIQKNHSNDQDAVPEEIAFLGKLFDFRRTVEFNMPKHRVGLTTSRRISPGQSVKLVIKGGGVYKSRVLENLRKYLVLSYPEGKRVQRSVSWKNQIVKLYFWRREDAGYYFETKVLGDYINRQVPILHLLHSDSLQRTQKRSSIRVGLNQAADIFPLSSESAVNEEWNTGSGYRCKVIDISESGAGILVRGRGKAGILLKLQTHLVGFPIVLCGSVRSAVYNESQHASILHIEAFPPSQLMKNRILTYVYGIFGAAAKDPIQSARSGQTVSQAPDENISEDFDLPELETIEPELEEPSAEDASAETASSDEDIKT